MENVKDALLVIVAHASSVWTSLHLEDQEKRRKHVYRKPATRWINRIQRMLQALQILIQIPYVITNHYISPGKVS